MSKVFIGNNTYKTICMDAGHCDKFTGAWYKNGAEKEETDNLKMALAIEKYLTSFGHKVIQTRRGGECLDSRNKNKDLEARPLLANKSKADYFVSIHRNSYKNESASGAEIWVYSKANASTVKTAECIQKEICAVTPIINRGVHKGYTGNTLFDYAVNRISAMPSCLIELLFISNPNDNLKYNKYFEEYAKAIAVGICKGLECNYTVVSDKQESKPTKLGRYCVGNFNEDTKDNPIVKKHLDAIKSETGWSVWYENI